jgi:hypothetical protein
MNSTHFQLLFAVIHFAMLHNYNCSKRPGKPYTAIIDGANIAYFGQNFEQGKFNFHQIQFLLEALESKGEHPLVIVPNKYVMNTFYSNTGPQAKRQSLTPKEIKIIQE